MNTTRYGEYGMFTDDGGNHWRGFARHYPSGEVYLLEQDQQPGMDGANYTGVLGPLHHSEITHETLEAAVMSNGSAEDADWAQGETWEPVEL